MKKNNCPVCNKELIRLEPFEKNVYEFWCDDCNIDIVITKNNKADEEILSGGKNNMSRIDNIMNFAQRKETERTEREMAKLNRIEEYKERIRALKPRIDELLEVGNACVTHGIAIEGKAFGGHEGYDTHQFISNSWSHLVGFVREYNQTTRKPMPFTKVGKIGGGACDYNLITDGVTIDVSGDVEYVLKKFLDNFDTFETEFYNYVDKVTA